MARKTNPDLGPGDFTDKSAPLAYECPNDTTVLELRGLGKYMHSTNHLSTFEHWECPDCGYTRWIYLPPNETPAIFADDIPF